MPKNTALPPFLDTTDRAGTGLRGRIPSLMEQGKKEMSGKQLSPEEADKKKPTVCD